MSFRTLRPERSASAIPPPRPALQTKNQPRLAHSGQPIFYQLCTTLPIDRRSIMSRRRPKRTAIAGYPIPRGVALEGAPQRLSMPRRTATYDVRRAEIRACGHPSGQYTRYWVFCRSLYVSCHDRSRINCPERQSVCSCHAVKAPLCWLIGMSWGMIELGA